MNKRAGSSKVIQVIMSPELIADLDAAAKVYYISRSEFIRQCVILRLKNPPGSSKV